MALRGNLRDFSLPDVFQLVTFSRKTGVLRIVRSDGAEGTVWFRDGEVFFASSNWHAEPLGERLVRGQRITPQALVRALEIRASEPTGGRRLGRILIDDGYITESVLETFVSEQIEDTIFDLMRWEEGEFDFEAMPEVVEEDIGLSVSIENIVMEGSRRLEEWGRIKKKIPSVDVVFKMATAPGEGTFEISLKPMEWQVLLLTDGSRSVADLAVATRRTDFEVARIVYGLLSAGLLEFATDEEIERSRAERTEREAKLAALQAERQAAERAQQQEALDREARLAEEARRRQLEQQAATLRTPQSPPQAPTLAHVTSAPAEEPQFLGMPAAPPTADDQAVLDQFMGAVLEQVSAPVAERPVQSIPAAAPHVPVEEPAFMAVDHGDDSETPLIPVSSIEDILPGLAAEAAAAADAVAASFAPSPGAPSAADAKEGSSGLPVAELPATALPGQPPTPVAVEPVVAPTAEPDFTRDLTALGLGELPEGYRPPAIEHPAEPMSAREVASTAPGAQIPGTTQPPASTQPPTAAAASAPDFSELMESLEVDAEHEQPLSPAEAGFDEDLLRDDSEQIGGVISTDAYLGDVGMADLGFSGGLTDELSALTGAERRQPARPQASVRALPQEGGVIQRDDRVDKDTVLRIIEGIKNL